MQLAGRDRHNVDMESAKKVKSGVGRQVKPTVELIYVMIIYLEQSGQRGFVHTSVRYSFIIICFSAVLNLFLDSIVRILFSREFQILGAW